jgi:hypothetical protein
MNPLAEYLTEKLTEVLETRCIIAWYDPKADFADYISSLGPPEPAPTGLPAVTELHLGGAKVSFARYAGSFHGLKFAVEPLFSAPEPSPLLIYLPGIERDLQESVLMEIEKAGEVFTPQFKRLVRQVLKSFLTDGDIDEIVNRPSLTYADVVALLHQRGAEAGAVSILKVIFSAAPDSAALLAAWLATPSSDDTIAQKQGEAELYRLIRSRLGLDLDAKIPLPEARDKALRYVLINEFREDLQGAQPPSSIGLIPKPADADQTRFCGKVAQALRDRHSDLYPKLADKVESALGLAEAANSPDQLGAVETFRFEEKALLSRCGKLIQDHDFDQALQVLEGRTNSFWLRHDVNRQAQWEACRLMAELGAKAKAVRIDMPGTKADAASWVSAYVANWHQADHLHRHLESWVAGMPSDPETEEALATVRGDYELMLRQQSETFATLLKAAAWSIPGQLHQTRVYEQVVTTGGGPVAYFLVDAMRYEMGLELARLLEDGQEMQVQHAVAALPTITPVGMAALLPGAASSFSVAEQKGKLAAQIEDTLLTGWQDRWKFWKGRVPDAVEMTLGKVLESTAGRLAKTTESASLVIVRSQELDSLGESGDNSLARQLMDTVLVNLVRAVRKLAAAGIQRFVITADHGHLFGEERGPDMVTENPGGDTLDIKRRCWIGRGGQTPPSTLRLTASELGYETDLEFVFPAGLVVLPAHDGLRYHHGSCSLQELLIPVLSFRLPSKAAKKTPGKVMLKGVPPAITNRVISIGLEVPSDLLSEPLVVRVVLLSGAEIVGQVGMALEADFDREKGILTLAPGKPVTVALMLVKEGCNKVKIVVLDAATDAVLEQSDELNVNLAI